MLDRLKPVHVNSRHTPGWNEKNQREKTNFLSLILFSC